MDVWGLHRQGLRDVKYYFSLVHDYSRFSWVFPIKEWNAEVIEAILEMWMKWAERFQTVQTGRNERILVIRTDNAKELAALEVWTARHGIEIEFTKPYTPARNGVAKRLNRLLLEIARALNFDVEVPRKYWQWAVDAANYIQNRSIEVTGTKDITPFELWTGEKPRLDHMRHWGCKVLYHERDGDKLASRALVGIFVEYTESNSQYLVITVDGKLRQVMNPVFLEYRNGHLSNSGFVSIEEDILGDTLASEDMEGGKHSHTNIEVIRDENEKGAGSDGGTSVGSHERTDRHEQDIDSRTRIRESKNCEIVQRKSQRLIEKENSKKMAEEEKIRENEEAEKQKATEEEGRKEGRRREIAKKKKKDREQ